MGVRSRVAGVKENELYYGFFPMSSHVVLRPVKVRPGPSGETGFVDGAPHREGLPVVYFQYERVNEATAGNLDLLCVLRRLFLTSFLIADLLLDEQRDVDRVLVTSASSKTAIALAQVLRVQRGEKLGSHSTK